jgi:hypothetical protein
MVCVRACGHRYTECMRVHVAPRDVCARGAYRPATHERSYPAAIDLSVTFAQIYVLTKFN